MKMAEKPLEELTLSEITKLLNDRKSELKKLLRKKESYQRKMEELDEQIDELQGAGSIDGIGGKRPQNVKPLHAYVREVLGKTKKGLPLGKLADKVLEAGYQTTSSNFKSTLYQCLYNNEDIVRDENSKNYVVK
jgi:DNA-binding transcriptional MerR regulator